MELNSVETGKFKSLSYQRGYNMIQLNDGVIGVTKTSGVKIVAIHLKLI